MLLVKYIVGQYCKSIYFLGRFGIHRIIYTSRKAGQKKHLDSTYKFGHLFSIIIVANLWDQCPFAPDVC